LELRQGAQRGSRNATTSAEFVERTGDLVEVVAHPGQLAHQRRIGIVAGIADWSSAIGAHVDLLAGDQIHPGEAGGRVFADTVATVVDGIENRRAELAYRVELLQWQSARAFDRPAAAQG